MGLTCKDGHLPHGGNGGFLDGHAFVFGALAYIWDCSPMAEFSGFVASCLRFGQNLTQRHLGCCREVVALAGINADHDS